MDSQAAMRGFLVCYDARMPIDIRPYGVSNKQGVGDLIVPIQQAEFGLPITLEQQPDLLDIENFYQNGAGNFWVACDGNDVVGTIALKDIGGRHAALRKMFVHKDYRGKERGVALQLLKTARDWGREQKLAAIYLGTTPQFLAAHRFYEKNGFIEVAVHDLPPAFPVMHIDKKFYRFDY